jgi:hypothetical protein
MAEISDAEYAELQQAHKLLKEMYADNAVGIDFKKLVKRKFPAASIPDLDAVVKVDELSGAMGKNFEALSKSLGDKIDGFLKDRTKEKEDQDVALFAARIEKVSKERGYTEDGTKALLGMMKDRGIGDVDDAVVIFESRQPKAPLKPRQFSSRMNFLSPEGEGDESFKELMRDPEQWMVDQLMSAVPATEE